MPKSKQFSILALLTILTGLFLQACSSHNDPKYSVEYLDSLVNVNPKSVYTILKKEADSIHTKEERNRYALYSLIAKDKLYVRHTSDSLPNALINYYENRNQNLLGLSYYMLGGSYSDMGDVPEAVKAYLVAGTKSHNHSAKIYTGLISNRLAYEYLKLGMYEEARNHYLLSLQNQSTVSDSTRLAAIYIQIATTHNVYNRDSVEYWLKKSYSIAEKNNDNYHKNLSLLKLTKAYLQNNDRKKANFYLNKIDSTTVPYIMKESYYLTRGEYYYNILAVKPHAKEELDFANYYFTKILHSKKHDTKSRAAYYLSILAKRKGDYKTAFNLIRERKEYDDSLHNKKILKATHKLEATYNYKLAQKAKEQAEDKARSYKNYTILLGLLLATFIALSLMAIRWRQLHAENKAFKDFALVKVLDGVRKNLGMRESNSSEKLTPKTLQAESPNSFIYSNGELTKNYKQFREMLEESDRTIKDSEWQGLLQAMNSTIPDFTKHMDLLISKISAAQEKYCYLTKLGFKQNEIALLIPMSESGVSQLKKRLVKKIDSDKVTTKNLAETIQNL